MANLRILAIKTSSICFMYWFIKKDRESHTKILRLTTETYCLMFNDFSVAITCGVSSLPVQLYG